MDRQVSGSDAGSHASITVTSPSHKEDDEESEMDEEERALGKLRSSLRLDNQHQLNFGETFMKAAAIMQIGGQTVLERICFQIWASEVKMMTTTLDFMVLPQWKSLADKSVYSACDVARLKSSRDMASSFERIETESSKKYGKCRWIMVDPCSQTRIVWDCLGALLLGFDTIMIPLNAFMDGKSDFAKGMDWFTLIFWTGDVVASCITGYVSRGVTVMSPGLILVNYLRTWFWIDLVVMGPDWFFTIMELRSDAPKGGIDTDHSQLLRAIRLLRMSRLLRLAKLRRIMTMIRDRIDSEGLFILLNVLKLIVMLLLVNHILASLWYAIGDFSRAMGHPNWIEVHGFDEEPIGYRYATSLHWSLTQFTPASMAVQPHNTTERTFAVLVLVFGLVLFSSFVSSITNSMTQLRSLSDDQSKQFWLLRRYLSQRHISKQLQFRILRYAEYVCKEQQEMVVESRVAMLGLLSDKLRGELTYEVSFSCLTQHPLFAHASTIACVTMHELSRVGALNLQSLAKGEVLFHAGARSTQMHIVDCGSLRYTKIGHYEASDAEVGRGDRLAEPALWTHWLHLGQVYAGSESKVVTIEATRFRESIRRDPMAWDLIAAYARQYVEWLSTTVCGMLTDVGIACEQGPIAEALLEQANRDRASTAGGTISGYGFALLEKTRAKNLHWAHGGQRPPATRHEAGSQQRASAGLARLGSATFNFGSQVSRSSEDAGGGGSLVLSQGSRSANRAPRRTQRQTQRHASVMSNILGIGRKSRSGSHRVGPASGQD